MDFNKIKLVAEDTLPAIAGRLLEDDGSAIDITGFVITLHIGYEEPLIKTADIPVGTDGYFSFPWAGADLKPGIWPAEVQIVSPSGKHTLQEVVSPYTGEKSKLKLHITAGIA